MAKLNLALKIRWAITARLELSENYCEYGKWRSQQTEKTSKNFWKNSSPTKVKCLEVIILGNWSDRQFHSLCFNYHFDLAHPILPVIFCHYYSTVTSSFTPPKIRDDVMADVGKHEIRTRLILKDCVQQKYLLIKEETSGAWAFPADVVRKGNSIAETAQNLFNKARFSIGEWQLSLSSCISCVLQTWLNPSII